MEGPGGATKSKGQARPNEQGEGRGVTQGQLKNRINPSVGFDCGMAGHTKSFCPILQNHKGKSGQNLQPKE